MSGTLSSTIVQPLVQAKTRTVNAISTPSSTPYGTPKTSIPAPAPQPPPSPGTWAHPKLREITSRQEAARFSSRSARIALANTALLITSLYFRPSLHTLLTYATSPLSSNYPPTTLATHTLTLLHLYILLNILLTLRPLSPYFATPDNLADIPLTPSQRSLLGLPPSPSPSTGYITPPRYRRSSSSFTSTSNPTSGRSISATYASSPRHTLGFSPSPQSPFRSTQRTASGSPFSYSPSASPLLQKAINRGFEDINFSASTSGLSRSQSVKERGVRSKDKNDTREPSTPSPGGFGGVKRDPGLNYKWLYQTGRGTGGRAGGLPKSESLFL